MRLFQRFTFELLPGQDPLELRQGLTLSPANGVWVKPLLHDGGGAKETAAPAAA